MGVATAVKRGCGTRKKGGAYAECGRSSEGMPLEHFLFDPPVRISPEEIGLAPIGVKLIEKGGIFHAFDWVGEQFYPNVCDFLEEVRLYGLSRRLAKLLDYSKLTAQSRIVMIHRRAWVEERRVYYEEWMKSGADTIPCPKKVPEHSKALLMRFDEMCAGVWWHDIELSAGVKVNERGQAVEVPLASGDFYYGVLRPKDHVPGYEPAIFASFPVSRVVVIRDPEGETHKEMLKKAKKSGLPVDVVDE